MTAVVTIDLTGIEAMLQPGGSINQNMEERARRVESAAKSRAPVNTGRMRAAGYITPSSEAIGAWDVVFPVNYSIFVNSGTRFMAARPFLTDSLPEAIR